MKYLNTIFLVVSFTGLAACAASPASTSVKEGQSLVTLESRIGHDMIARRLDEEQAPSLTHFTLSQPRHTLEVGITKPGVHDTHRRCIANVTYDQFVANQHYTLVESTSDTGLDVALIDGTGKSVARAGSVACL